MEESPNSFPPINCTKQHNIETTPPSTTKTNKPSSTNKKSATKANKKTKKTKQLTSSTTASASKNPKNKPGVTTVVVDGSRNVSVNMCSHCSRVFCGRKALYVHTLKMHGKEYLKKRTPQVKASPFTCWFCSANFASPEGVVEHMTNAHENLDKLSKRIEMQNLPAGTTALPTKIADPTPKFIPIAPHKQVLPVAPLRSGPTTVAASSLQPALNSTQPLDNQPSHHHHRQPPPGFKMSYALAYVPVFVPDRPEDDETEHHGDEQAISMKKSWRKDFINFISADVFTATAS